MFLGGLLVTVAASEDIKEPLGLLALSTLGVYLMWSGRSGGRREYSLKDGAMLLFGEALTTATMAAAVVILGRWLV